MQPIYDILFSENLTELLVIHFTTIRQVRVHAKRNMKRNISDQGSTTVSALNSAGQSVR